MVSIQTIDNDDDNGFSKTGCDKREQRVAVAGLFSFISIKKLKIGNNGVIMNINRGRIHPITVRLLKIMYQLQLCVDDSN